MPPGKSSASDHVDTEAELDAIEEIDPALALRIDRAQTLAEQARAARFAGGPGGRRTSSCVRTVAMASGDSFLNGRSTVAIVEEES